MALNSVLKALSSTPRIIAHDLAAARNFSATADKISKIGFIGLGAMGSRMADTLIKAGHDLVVHDWRISKMNEFSSKEGVQTASSPAALAEEEGLRVLITMLPSCKEVESVYCGQDGILSAEGGVQPSLLIDSSTVSPVTAQRVASAVASTQLHRDAQPFPGCSSRSPMMVDAPVSGGITGAAAGTLTFMCGGDRSAVKAADPVLRSMGKKVWHCGEAGLGQAAKVTNNLALAIQMASIAEASALGRRWGLDPKLLADIFNSSSARCWSSESYNPVPGVMSDVPASRHYEDGFATGHMIKDLGLAISTAQHSDSPVPMGERVLELYRKVAEGADETVDFAAIYKYIYDPAAGDSSTEDT